MEFLLLKINFYILISILLFMFLLYKLKLSYTYSIALSLIPILLLIVNETIFKEKNLELPYFKKEYFNDNICKLGTMWSDPEKKCVPLLPISTRQSAPIKEQQIEKINEKVENKEEKKDITINDAVSLPSCSVYPFTEKYGGKEPPKGEEVIMDEFKYSTYNNLYVPENYKSEKDDWGYSYLPPEKWFENNPHPPVCVCSNRCPIIPLPTHGYPMDLKEWNASRRVMPPDGISVKYVEEKLNSGN